MVNFGFSIFFLFLLPFFLVHLLRMFELGREGGGERVFKRTGLIKEHFLEIK